MKNTVDPWAGCMGAESSFLLEKDFPVPSTSLRQEGLFRHVQGKGVRLRRGRLVGDLPTSSKSHYRILDWEQELPIERWSRAATAMMKTV
jgi:hypothetical protein